MRADIVPPAVPVSIAWMRFSRSRIHGTQGWRHIETRSKRRRQRFGLGLIVAFSPHRRSPSRRPSSTGVAESGRSLPARGPSALLASRMPRLELLTALAPTGRFLPDFLLSPPTEPWGVLADELDAVAATPPAVVRADLKELCDGQPLPTVLRPLYDDPAAHLPAVVQEMRRYWQVAVEPVWHRLRALSMADLSSRMERFADGGIARVFGDLHPDVAFEHDRLQIDKPQHNSHRHSLDLAGTGIVLVPRGFSWPTLIDAHYG